MGEAAAAAPSHSNEESSDNSVNVYTPDEGARNRPRTRMLKY
jgi:hypothetical protein